MNIRLRTVGKFIIFVGIFTLLLLPALAFGAEADTAEVEKVATQAIGTLTGFHKAILGICAVGAVAISCIMSGYALAKIGAAALGAMSEKPEIGGRALIFLGMAEGIAIYGLIIAIMLLIKI